MLVWHQVLLLLNPSLCAQCTLEPSKPKRWSLELRKVILLAGQGVRFLKATFGVRIAGIITFFWLVGGEVAGWCSRNLNHQPSSSNQSGVSVPVHAVTILHLGGGHSSLQSNSKTCVRLFCISLEGELGRCIITEVLFLECLSFVSAFSHFPN